MPPSLEIQVLEANSRDGVDIMISRIGNHVYAKDAAAAVKLYMEAFDLLEQGKPWLDKDGFIIHQDLVRKNGDLFLGVTDCRHLPSDAFRDKFTAATCPSMLFYVFYFVENDLRRTFTILSEGAVLCRDLEAEGKDTVCEVVDKFGVFWHLRLVAPENQNAWNVKTLFGCDIEN